MVEIGRDTLLGNELFMRGGTCLHKLHLAQPLRYSEDLDYVRSTRSGIGPYLDNRWASAHSDQGGDQHPRDKLLFRQN